MATKTPADHNKMKGTGYTPQKIGFDNRRPFNLGLHDQKADDSPFKMTENEYWYKIGGKTVTKAEYNKYKNPVGDGPTKSTNDPDASGNKANIAKNREKLRKPTVLTKKQDKVKDQGTKITKKPPFKAKFKPHMMYKGSDEVMAKTYEKHLELKNKGYSHTKPKSPTKTKDIKLKGKKLPKGYTKKDKKFLKEQREDVVRYEDLDAKGRAIWKKQGKKVPKKRPPFQHSPLNFDMLAKKSGFGPRAAKGKDDQSKELAKSKYEMGQYKNDPTAPPTTKRKVMKDGPKTNTVVDPKIKNKVKGGVGNWMPYSQRKKK